VKALVVYESHWGNTAGVAAAIAAGIGEGARAVSTSDATPEAVSECDLLVVGAPLLGFSLPTPEMVASLARPALGMPEPADVSHPSVREWLGTVPPGPLAVSAFETRIWWSPGSAMGTIAKTLEAGGHRLLSPPVAFRVSGRYGPVKDGELERAKAWGTRLASLLG